MSEPESQQSLSESEIEPPEYEPGERSVPLDAITAGITNVRTDPGDVSTLAESIKTKGLIHPVVLRKSQSNPAMFEVVAGSRRVAAMYLLKEKRIKARVVRCDDAGALCLSLDENNEHGDLSAREQGEVIERLKRLCPGDPGDERAVRKWVAQRLNWYIIGTKGKKYPDVSRVARAEEDSRFQTLVPGIEIKIRNKGDFKRPTAPLSVARQVMPILAHPTAVQALNQKSKEDAQKIREDFLRVYSETKADKRKDLKEAFIQDPLKPVLEIKAEVERNRGLLVPCGFKAPTELLDRIDAHRRATNPEWTRSDSVRDLVEKGLTSVGLTPESATDSDSP